MTSSKSFLSNCGSSGMIRFCWFRIWVEAVGVEPTGVSFKDSASNLAAPSINSGAVENHTGG